jgi:hypothetical protein
LWFEEKSSLKWLYERRLWEVAWWFFDTNESQAKALCFRGTSCANGGGFLGLARGRLLHSSHLVVTVLWSLGDQLPLIERGSARRKCDSAALGIEKVNHCGLRTWQHRQ